MGKGGIIGKANNPTSTIASGIWNLREQYAAKRNSSWPSIIYNSAVELVNAGFTTDGVYLINLPTVGVTNVYCLLDPKWDGGGWMLAMKAATGTTFNYSSNYWTTDNTLNPTDVTQNAGDAKFEVMNKFSAKDIFARWPDISSNSGQIANVGTWTWLRNNFNSGNRSTLISFFSTSSQITVTSGVANTKASGAWGSGIFSSQSGFGFYGFNYTGNGSARTRWGFGWNNETDQNSNDVSGGIGMDSSYGSYSAGDRINCCQDTAGINRQARVEIYVR